jgi:hypothetical protein
MDGELWAALYRFIELVDKSHAQDPRNVHGDAAAEPRPGGAALPRRVGRGAGHELPSASRRW